MAYGLLNTYKGLRFVEWRSDYECWDNITSEPYASSLGNYAIRKEQVDFDLEHIIEFIIENPSSLGLGVGPCEEILYELKKEKNWNRLSKFYQDTVDWCIHEHEYWKRAQNNIK